MKSNSIPVHIYFVLDRSGSMTSMATDVVGGFNRFIEEQKTLEGRCRLTMIQFDSQDAHEVLYNAVEIDKVSPLTTETFHPRGGTPLLDAEGWMINHARERVATRKGSDKKAEAVLFVTYTDGMENASTEWTHEALTRAKKECEEEGWTFTYLGCGHDAYSQSGSIGTHANATQAFAADSRGVRASYSSLSTATKNLRSRANVGERVASANFYDNSGKGAEEDLFRRS
jgi:Mg-chelatase subunit ChlD